MVSRIACGRSLLFVRARGARLRGDDGEIGEIGESLGEGLMDISLCSRRAGRVN